MLIEFSIENFRSIKDKVTFSLVASRSDHSLQDNLIPGDTAVQEGGPTKLNALGKGNNLLKSAVIYGANASGKTNVLISLSYIKRIVIESLNNTAGDKIKTEPFKLDSRYSNLPCTFDLDFIHEGIRYNYGASFTSEKVIKEYLYYYPKGSRSQIFVRDINNDPVFNPKVDKGQQNRIAKETNDNVFYLANSSQRNYSKTSNVIMWLKTCLNFLDIIEPPITIQLVESNLVSSEEILLMLKNADLDIFAFKVTTNELSLENIPEELKFLLTIKKDKPLLEKRLNTYHKGIDENGKVIDVEFHIEEESAGTKKLFSLLGPCLDSMKTGSVLIIDELDSRLHPFVCEYLVKLFNHPNINKNNAQLIFATHNTYLLNLELLRRDQIWFTNKNQTTKSTELYSLLEFKQRTKKKFETPYLDGRYGAIPYIEDMGK